MKRFDVAGIRQARMKNFIKDGRADLKILRTEAEKVKSTDDFLVFEAAVRSACEKASVELPTLTAGSGAGGVSVQVAEPFDRYVGRLRRDGQYQNHHELRVSKAARKADLDGWRAHVETKSA